MPTIQFTFDKENNHYCFGFWVDGKFVVRNKSSNKEEIWEHFKEELERLEQD